MEIWEDLLSVYKYSEYMIATPLQKPENRVWLWKCLIEWTSSFEGSLESWHVLKGEENGLTTFPGSTMSSASFR